MAYLKPKRSADPVQSNLGIGNDYNELVNSKYVDDATAIQQASLFYSLLSLTAYWVTFSETVEKTNSTSHNENLTYLLVQT